MCEQKPWLAHYEKGVGHTLTYPDVVLHQMLANSAKKYPRNLAVRMVLKYLSLGIPIESKMTYAQLNEMTDRFALALHNLGVGKGDRVAVILPNLPQMIITFYSVTKIGAIVVTTNPMYTAREIQHQLNDSGAETVVMLSGIYERLASVRSQTQIKNVILTDVPDTLGFPFNKLVEKEVKTGGQMADVPPGPDTHRLFDLIKNHQPTPPKVDIVPEDVALFQYTGGTTGVPKAAMLTHRNIASNVIQLSHWFTSLEYGKEKMLGAIPFFHVYGMTVSMGIGIYAGSEIIVVPDPRNIEHIMEVIHREKCTIFPGVPALYIGIINHPKVARYNLRSIKACISGASPLPMEVQESFGRITGGKLVEGYGLTEAAPTTHANPIHGLNKAGSIGIPISDVDSAIVALEPNEDGRYPSMEVGEEGEMVIKGPQVMKGYWNMPDETATSIDEEGWLHTGDIARMDEDGYFYIVDRKKDLIIASGYNIVPREVEEVLYAHPKVQEAVVAGVPDKKRGETVKAYIVLKEGQTATVGEITDHCKENLASFKVPKLVEFRTELPKSTVGKFLRRVLVDEEKQKMEQMT